jgi:hypothetical protein
MEMSPTWGSFITHAASASCQHLKETCRGLGRNEPGDNLARQEAAVCFVMPMLQAAVGQFKLHQQALVTTATMLQADQQCESIIHELAPLKRCS